MTTTHYLCLFLGAFASGVPLIVYYERLVLRIFRIADRDAHQMWQRAYDKITTDRLNTEAQREVKTRTEGLC